MVSTREKVIVALTLCGACLFATEDAFGQVPRFRLTDLGLPTNGVVPKAHAINDHGQVVGEVTYDHAGQNEAEHAFLWLPEADYGLAAGMHDLTDLAGLTAAGQDGAAFDINDDGIIVGSQDLAGLPIVAFAWDMSQYDPNNYDWAYDLGSLFTGAPKTQLDEGGTAYGVNNANPAVIVGKAGELPVGFQITLPHGGEDAEFEILSPLVDSPTDYVSVGHDVNMIDPIAVVGGSSPGTGFQPDCFPYNDAVRWTTAGSPRPAIELPAFLDPNNQPDYSEAEALGLDEQDPPRMVGWGREQIDYVGEPSDCMARALFWEWNEQSQVYDVANLGALVGGAPDPRQSSAWSIRDADPGELVQVVGLDEDFNEALLWERDGANWSLATLFDEIQTCCTWVNLTTAEDINTDGWITGRGVDQLTDWRVYVLTPPSDCPQDVNGDGTVDINDVFDVTANWGDCPVGAICTWDLDYNCVVDVDDLFLVINGPVWGDCDSESIGGRGLAMILNGWLRDGGEAALRRESVSWDQVNACLANESEDGVEACLYGLLKN